MRYSLTDNSSLNTPAGPLQVVHLLAMMVARRSTPVSDVIMRSTVGCLSVGVAKDCLLLLVKRAIERLPKGRYQVVPPIEAAARVAVDLLGKPVVRPLVKQHVSQRIRPPLRTVVESVVESPRVRSE